MEHRATARSSPWICSIEIQPGERNDTYSRCTLASNCPRWNGNRRIPHVPLVGLAEESKVSGEKPVGVGDALRRSSRIFILSSARDDGAPRPAWVAVGRAALFLAFWLMIAGYDPVDLPIGLITAAAATWTSLRLLPAVKVQLRLLSLATFALHFLRQSASSGVEVAWRAFSPRLPLDPGFVVYPCRLRSAGTRSAFCALSSLLPGHVAGRLRRKRRPPRPLPRCRPARRGQSRRGGSVVQPGDRP